MALLTKDQIVQADDRRSKTVPVPEWGGDVFVLEMNGARRIEYERLMEEAKEAGEKFDRVSYFVAHSVVDPTTREPLFKVEEIPALQAKSAAVLLSIFNAAIEVNALSREAVETAKGE